MKGLDKEILRLALPSILASLTVPLVGMVDLAIAGHLDGEAATIIGGIAIGGMLFDILYWSFGFLRAGTGGLTAQAWGRRDMADCGRILIRSIGTALAISLVLILLQWPFQKLCFTFLKSSEGVRELALEYYFIRIWAAPATLSLMALRGWFIGMQDSVSSMCADVVVNGMNILASLLLSRRIGFAGIAWGTVLAQYSGLAFAFAVILFKYRGIPFNLKDIRSHLTDGMGRFFSVNGDLFIRSLALVVVYISFTSLSAAFGDLPLSGATIMMKLLLLFSYFTDGFAYAGEALTGRFFGERNPLMVNTTVRRVFIWSFGIGLLFIVLYYAMGDPLLRLLTDDDAVREYCHNFFFWLLPMPLVGCAAFTWDGIYTGATATRQMRDSTLASVAGFFLVYYIGKQFILNTPGGGALLADKAVAPVHILLAAYFTHLLVRSLWQTIAWPKAKARSV